MVYIICGVAGAGKTRVGKVVSERLGCMFYDADFFHSPSSINKMRQGVALEENDRQPWLELLAEKIDEWNLFGDAVLACSVLKEQYRELLSNTYRKQAKFIFLDVDQTVAYKRIRQRGNHFFSPDLLANQFAILEKPEKHILVDANMGIEYVCDAVFEKIMEI